VKVGRGVGPGEGFVVGLLRVAAVAEEVAAEAEGWDRRGWLGL
jgi:hypothetical protein